MNEKIKKDKIKNIVIATILAIVVLIFGIIFMKECSKEEIKKTEKVPAKEEDIILAYKMSKEDAINIVKEIYNSDVYEFEAEINEDSKYIVTVKNTITESISKFLVDPTNTGRSFYEINE